MAFDPKRKARSYTVTYNSDSHVAVLTQMWGSIWPQVLPYCLFNVGLMIVLSWIDHRYEGKYNIEISAQGHTFMSLVVAFLLVSRVNIGLARYNQARDCLTVMYRLTRELVQNICVLSANNRHMAAAEWRNEVTFRVLLLLRTVMAVVDYPETQQPAWTVPQLRGEIKEDVTNALFVNQAVQHLAHEERNEWEESMRVPIRVAYLLRKAVHTQGDRLEEPLAISHENRISGNVDAFMKGYYGIRTFMTTPVPFPLIQMARTFLFLYVFTVPFVLLSASVSSLIAHCFTLFLLTYGFVGLELVGIQLDDPFGDDENDFDNGALAETAYEDSYLTILDIDGPDWADKLRLQMHDGVTKGLSEQQKHLFESANAKEV